MPELTVKEVEVVRDIPGNPPEKGGPAKVLRISFEGDERQPELFATAKTPIPSVGEKMDETRLEFNKDWNRWQFRKQGGGGGGAKKEYGWQTHPIDAARMGRAHAQDMAMRREADLIASGKRGPFTEEELIEVINWFQWDCKNREVPKNSGVLMDGMTSDVPADQEDLFDPVAESSR